MNDLRIARLVQALSATDIGFIKSRLKSHSNKFYVHLLAAFELLKTKNLSREEIYLRVYKKKWSSKLDAAFRTDLSRLADFIEETLIQQRLEKRIATDKKWYEEEKLQLLLDLNLTKEVEQQYQLVQQHTSFPPYDKNKISYIFAEYIIRINASLKDKLSLMENIRKDAEYSSLHIAEITQAKTIFLKCMHNYYHKQFDNHYFETIDTNKLLKKVEAFNSIEAKYIVLSGVTYLKIDSQLDAISIKVYEQSVAFASQLMLQDETFSHHKIRALHLIGTRYSILGSFEIGNSYFEEGIQIIPKEQYRKYKTIVLNYATNCSKLLQFDKALQLIHLLDDDAKKDNKLKTECSIRSLSCYLFMENAEAIFQEVKSQDYNQIQAHEKIYFRLCQCDALLMSHDFELAQTEITNLLRSKLMQEIDAAYLPATELMNFLITAIYKNGKLKLTASQQKQFESLKSIIKFADYPYLKHYSPYLWLEQKLLITKNNV